MRPDLVSGGAVRRPDLRKWIDRSNAQYAAFIKIAERDNRVLGALDKLQRHKCDIRIVMSLLMGYADPPSADDLSSLRSRVGTGCYRSTSRRPAGAGTFDVRGGSPSGSLTLCGDQMLGPFEASQ